MTLIWHESRGSRLHLKGRVELFFFFGGRWADDPEPFLVNMDEAGRAGTTAAAFGDDAGNVVAQGRFHHCRTELRFYGVLRPIVFDVGDLRHSRHAEFLLQACR